MGNKFSSVRPENLVTDPAATTVARSAADDDSLYIAGVRFSSRLFVGTGKFSSAKVMLAVVQASQTEMVTVALRRVDLKNPADDMIQPLVTAGVRLLPNTSGARNSAEAVRLARLAREGLGTPWLKLEVTPDPHTLLPDPVETLEATRILAAEGFTVLPYMPPDPILAQKLQDVGAAAVMPLGSLIGSNQGLLSWNLLEVIIAQAKIPVIVDAGIGVPSHAAQALEMGASAVLVNTALAVCDNPPVMAQAFQYAVRAGRLAYLSGPGVVSLQAQASSPLTGFLDR